MHPYKFWMGSDRLRYCIRLGTTTSSNLNFLNARFYRADKVLNITSKSRHDSGQNSIYYRINQINKGIDLQIQRSKFSDMGKVHTPYRSEFHDPTIIHTPHENKFCDLIKLHTPDQIDAVVIKENVCDTGTNIKVDVNRMKELKNFNLKDSFKIKEPLNVNFNKIVDTNLTVERNTSNDTRLIKKLLSVHNEKPVEQHEELVNWLAMRSSPIEYMLCFYRRVSSFLSCEPLIEKPKYIKGKHLWICMYTVKWPDFMIFLAKGHNKNDAAHQTAQSVLLWLTQMGRINNRGRPIFANLLNFPNSYQQVRLFSTNSCQFNKQTVTEGINSDPNKVSVTRGRREESDTIIGVIKKQFPAPKNVLHNFFNIISQELQQKNFKLEPQYKQVKHSKSSNSWMCLYNIKWPEKIEISKVGRTKQEASQLAALSALAWLKSKNKINDSGMPLIYDKEEAQKKMKSIAKPLLLSTEAKNRINEIVNIFNNKFLPSINNEIKNTKVSNLTSEKLFETSNSLDASRQNYLDLNRYLAKEPVKLPVSYYKDEFIKLLDKSRVIIIKGEPGCGKSTRIPQYVLEAWAKEDGLDGKPCRIAVTQPRRIAALSLARRVSNEREESVGNIVGYQVRLKSNFNKKRGRILYCTTGILLRHLQTDPKLTSFTHILLDEAHERDVNTDLLMNLLRITLNVNRDLKLIVMSATIDTSMFQQYFEGSQVMHIPGFTYPVKENFLNEIKGFDKTKQMCEGNFPSVVHEDVVSMINFIHRNRKEGAILCFLPGWDDIKKIHNLLLHTHDAHDMSVLCLHSRLQDDEQNKIFSRPPPGVRKVILATNIAETSVTIDDVVYVVDTGIHKEERFDANKGIMCIDNHWVSKASMKQRKGRAGRCQEGESFHMYTKPKYDTFEDFTMPEILRTSLTKIVLDSKVYSNNMNAIEFLSQLPSPPDKIAIKRAVDDLVELELLDDSENLTPLGKTLSEFQLEPKLSKAMVNSVIFKCVTPVVDIVTLFSGVSELFTSGLIDKEGVKKIKMKYSSNSDHLALMRIFEDWLKYFENGDEVGMSQICYENSLIPHRLVTIQKLRNVHFEYLEKGLSNVLPISDDRSDNDQLVCAVLFSGVGTVLRHNSWDIVKGRLKNVNVFLTRHNQRATITTESVNSKRGKFSTDFLLHINETQSNIRRSTIIRETSLISPLAVLLFKNNTLSIEDIPTEKNLDHVKSNDQVLVKLLGSKIQFTCDREDATILANCKDALKKSMGYYISKLTQKESHLNSDANEYWDDILSVLDKLFSKQNVS